MPIFSLNKTPLAISHFQCCTCSNSTETLKMVVTLKLKEMHLLLVKFICLQHCLCCFKSSSSCVLSFLGLKGLIEFFKQDIDGSQYSGIPCLC